MTSVNLFVDADGRNSTGHVHVLCWKIIAGLCGLWLLDITASGCRVPNHSSAHVFFKTVCCIVLWKSLPCLHQIFCVVSVIDCFSDALFHTHGVLFRHCYKFNWNRFTFCVPSLFSIKCRWPLSRSKRFWYRHNGMLWHLVIRCFVVKKSIFYVKMVLFCRWENISYMVCAGLRLWIQPRGWGPKSQTSTLIIHHVIALLSSKYHVKTLIFVASCHNIVLPSLKQCTLRHVIYILQGNTL